MFKYYWVEFVFIVVYFMNRFFIIVIYKKILFEVFNSEKLDYIFFRVFECICFVYVLDEKCNKFDLKVWK